MNSRQHNISKTFGFDDVLPGNSCILAIDSLGAQPLVFTPSNNTDLANVGMADSNILIPMQKWKQVRIPPSARSNSSQMYHHEPNATTGSGHIDPCHLAFVFPLQGSLFERPGKNHELSQKVRHQKFLKALATASEYTPSCKGMTSTARKAFT